MNKKRILFVDDNQGILDGLRRALRSERGSWDMLFVSSGEEAFDLMSKISFDAVITDMRMPGIDGVQLLDGVSHLYPGVIRFILSGHSKEDMTLQSVKSAHQFFPKPCNIDSLKEALDRSFYQRSLISDPKLQAVVSGIVSLPSIPQIYSEMVEQLNSPEVSIGKVGEIMSQDPAISAKIIQMVNSAFFGLGRHVSNPAEAARLLGIDIIRHLVLSVGLFSQFSEERLRQFGLLLEELVGHSIRVGLLAKRIAMLEKVDKYIVEQSYLSGFLHNVGILILVDNFPEQYKKVVELMERKQVDTFAAEREVFGNDHAAVGAYLFGLWGFSDEVLEAVAFHHMPYKSGATQFSPLTAVHVASAMEDARSQKKTAQAPEWLDMEYLGALGLEGSLLAWKALCDS